MRPHRLRVTAFGPFPGTVDLDLDEVSEAGPFLLRGATGAGKTSLLDAVGYALFGRVPGARGLKQLRSDHAEDATRTSVELWATVGGRAVHVVRTPDQRRPRSRGTGWTTDKAGVSVRVARDLAALDADECDARWSGVQEANSELADLVGMTHEQFVQVVLLPQGDFARFLRAKDEDRADVLRALFDTSRFTAVEQLLKERRDRARTALADADAAVAAAAAAVAAHAGADPPGTDLTPWAQELLEQAGAAVGDAAAAATGADDALTSTRARHTGLLTRSRLLSELATAARTRQQLHRGAPTVAEQARELDEADRAAEVVALHEAHRTALIRADETVEAARDALAGLPQDVGSGDPDLGDLCDLGDLTDLDELDVDAVVELSAGLRRHVDDAVATNAALEALGRDVERWQRLQGDLAGRRGERDVAVAAVDELRTRAQELPGRVQAAEAELHDLQQRAGAGDGARREVERWDRAAALTGRLATLAAAVDESERADLAARAEQRAAEQTLDRLRRARLEGMAAELAAALVDGEPCGVCGSTLHPAPADDGDRAVDPLAEEQARALALRAAAAAATTAAEVAGALTRLQECHTRLAAEVTPQVEVPDPPALTGPVLTDLDATVAQVLEQARADLRAAEEATTAARACATRLDGLRQEQSRHGAALATAESARDLASAALLTCQGQSEQLRVELHAALGTDPADEPPAAVWGRAATAGLARLTLLRAAGDAADDCVGALQELHRTRDTARAAARAAGWADVAAAAAAARPRSWRDEVRAVVGAHERDLHAATVRTRELAEALDLPIVAAADPDGSVGDAGDAGDGDDGDDGEHVDDLLADTVERLARAQHEEADLAEQLAAAERARRDAEAVLAAARSLRDGLARTVPRLVEAGHRAGPLRARAETTRALADLCNGGNDRGVALSTYVLAAHLQQVVEAANLRLHGMSDGRYALLHVEEGEDRRRRAGLGLAVLDAWTGRQRPAGTLSGGETFLASLALALGLADVVTAEAGGARIDALFVDEGFGTLDADSLDRAMDVLDRLQEHGRMVGVVSHVAELQQRLPRQVQVEHGRHGSTVRVDTG